MTLSAARSMQPHRPKAYEREGLPVREEDEHGWDEFAVDVVLGVNTRRFGPLPEAEARRTARLTAESGMPAVLLRWDGDGWAEVARFAAAPPASKLGSVKARPYSSWRR
jgi:hypothetical protein